MYTKEISAMNIRELSELPELNLSDAANVHYHGLGKHGLNTAPHKYVKFIEDYMTKKIKGFSKFCNFTDQTPNRVRYLLHYSPDFIGVDYLDVTTLINMESEYAETNQSHTN